MTYHKTVREEGGKKKKKDNTNQKDFVYKLEVLFTA